MNILADDFDVSEALVSDADGHTLRAVKDELESMKTKIKKEMDKGLPNDQFTVANNLHKACQTAQDLVEQFWSQPRR